MLMIEKLQILSFPIVCLSLLVFISFVKMLVKSDRVHSVFGVCMIDRTKAF